MKLDQAKVDESWCSWMTKVLDLAYDPGNQYSVPYFSGTVGIVYTPRKCL